MLLICGVSGDEDKPKLPLTPPIAPPDASPEGSAKKVMSFQYFDQIFDYKFVLN